MSRPDDVHERHDRWLPSRMQERLSLTQHVHLVSRVISAALRQAPGPTATYIGLSVVFLILQALSVTWVVHASSLLDGTTSVLHMTVGPWSVSLGLGGFILAWAGILLSATFTLFLARRASLSGAATSMAVSISNVQRLLASPPRESDESAPDRKLAAKGLLTAANASTRFTVVTMRTLPTELAALAAFAVFAATFPLLAIAILVGTVLWGLLMYPVARRARAATVRRRRSKRDLAQALIRDDQGPAGLPLDVSRWTHDQVMTWRLSIESTALAGAGVALAIPLIVGGLWVLPGSAPVTSSTVLAAIAVVRIVVPGLLDGLSALAKATRNLEGLRVQAVVTEWSRADHPTDDWTREVRAYAATIGPSDAEDDTDDD